MKNCKKSAVAMASLLSTLVFVSGNAHAGDIPFNSLSCLGGNTAVCVKERTTIFEKEPVGQYQITNNSKSAIALFGVSNSEAKNAFSTYSKAVVTVIPNGYYEEIGDPDYPDSGDRRWVDTSETIVQISKWNGGTFSKAEWNDGITFVGYGSDYSFGNENFVLRSNELGSFEGFFGTQDTSVNVYWHVEGYEFDSFSRGSLDNFYWQDSQPRSHFTAFGAYGQVLASSVTAVPEPATYAMLVAGLGVLGFAARRQKA